MLKNIKKEKKTKRKGRTKTKGWWFFLFFPQIKKMIVNVIVIANIALALSIFFDIPLAVIALPILSVSSFALQNVCFFSC